MSDQFEIVFEEALRDFPLSEARHAMELMGHTWKGYPVTEAEIRRLILVLYRTCQQDILEGATRSASSSGGYTVELYVTTLGHPACNINYSPPRLDVTRTDPRVTAPLVEIEEARLEKLEQAAKFLAALEQAGVDNWDGYSYAYDILEETK